jgi:hypothetical protein
MALAEARGPGKTFCPSEAARQLSPQNWRALMSEMRRVASTLPLSVTQKSAPVDPVTARGPIRFGLRSKGCESR